MEGNTFYFEFEVALMEWLQVNFGTIGSLLARFFTVFGEELVLVGVLVFLYWCYDKKFAEYVGTNIVASLVWNPLLKNIFLRRRPYFDHETIKCLKPVHADRDIYDISAQGYSFPSGHSTNSAALYGSLASYKKNKFLNVIAIVAPLLVGCSRFMLGVHYPTDVFAGWLLGLISVVLVSYMQKHISNQWILHGILVLSALPGIFYCKTEDYYTSFGIMIGFFLAVHFEKRFVNFKNTRIWWKALLRIAAGISLYFILSAVLKILFAGLPVYFGRFLRYGIVVFLLIGVYPMSFDKVGKKHG